MSLDNVQLQLFDRYACPIVSLAVLDWMMRLPDGLEKQLWQDIEQIELCTDRILDARTLSEVFAGH